MAASSGGHVCGEPTATTYAMASLAVAFCPFTLGVVYAFLLTLGVAMTCAWTALYDFKQRVKETDPRDAAAWEATMAVTEGLRFETRSVRRACGCHGLVCGDCALC